MIFTSTLPFSYLRLTSSYRVLAGTDLIKQKRDYFIKRILAGLENQA